METRKIELGKIIVYSIEQKFAVAFYSIFPASAFRFNLEYPKTSSNEEPVQKKGMRSTYPASKSFRIVTHKKSVRECTNQLQEKKNTKYNYVIRECTKSLEKAVILTR